MLSQVMLVQQFLLYGAFARLQGQGMEVQKGHLLQHHRVVDGVLGTGAPGEGAVAAHQGRRHLIRTAGTRAGSRPRSRKVSMMTFPVSSS